MTNDDNKASGIELRYPDGRTSFFTHLFLDYNGTLASRGRLLPGVRERLLALSQKLKIHVLTADTFGTVNEELGGLPLEIHTHGSGLEKSKFVLRYKDSGTVAIGNGGNDVPMFKAAQMGIAILGPEGLARDLIDAASVVVPSIQVALDLLLEPVCLVATTRQ